MWEEIEKRKLRNIFDELRALKKFINVLKYGALISTIALVVVLGLVVGGVIR